jgi:hypothetical protein
LSCCAEGLNPRLPPTGEKSPRIMGGEARIWQNQWGRSPEYMGANDPIRACRVLIRAIGAQATSGGISCAQRNI